VVRTIRRCPHSSRQRQRGGDNERQPCREVQLGALLGRSARTVLEPAKHDVPCARAQASAKLRGRLMRHGHMPGRAEWRRRLPFGQRISACRDRSATRTRAQHRRFSRRARASPRAHRQGSRSRGDGIMRNRRAAHAGRRSRNAAHAGASSVPGIAADWRRGHLPRRPRDTGRSPEMDEQQQPGRGEPVPLDANSSARDTVEPARAPCPRRRRRISRPRIASAGR